MIRLLLNMSTSYYDKMRQIRMDYTNCITYTRVLNEIDAKCMQHKLSALQQIVVSTKHHARQLNQSSKKRQWLSARGNRTVEQGVGHAREKSNYTGFRWRAANWPTCSVRDWDGAHVIAA